MVEEDDQRREQGEDDEATEERGLLQTARQAFARSFDRLSGAEFRQQFEEFTNVVTTTILGIHRDQAELRKRLERAEHICWQSAQVGQIRTREDYYYEELRGSSLRVLL